MENRLRDAEVYLDARYAAILLNVQTNPQFQEDSEEVATGLKRPINFSVTRSRWGARHL